MEMLLGGVGLLACVVLMMVVIPLARKLFGRVGSDSEESRDFGRQEEEDR